MGTIVWSTNLSLDGIAKDPDGAEGTQSGGWFATNGGADLEPWSKVVHQEAEGANALLLGRRTDEWFGSRWNTREGEWADRLRAIPKYVVSATIDSPVWQNSTVLRGDVVTEVSRLKAETDGEIVVYASYQLGMLLLEHDLIDELRLFVFPVVLGLGSPLFADLPKPLRLQLLSTDTIGENLTRLAYRVQHQT